VSRGEIVAKDDYFVVAYKILVYLYAVLKREIVFDNETFKRTVKKDVVNEDYFNDILYLMTEQGLISGLDFINVWGGNHVLVSDLSGARITVAGISYLQDNDKMKRVGEILKESADIIVSLAAKIIGL